MAAPSEVVPTFVAGCQAVLDAVADPVVGGVWDAPSVLEEQTVGSLAGHLARGAVWAVGDYLDAGEPSRPADFASAGEYFATLVALAGPEDNRAIRDRGAKVGAVGQESLVATLRERILTVVEQVSALPAERLVRVAAGKVLRLDDYLATRIVEQVVHLDDLARSVDRERWPYPAAGRDIAIAVGVEVATRLHGSDAVIRALYRRGFAADILPVL